jgi:uncharacterized cupredoxin-like copper-binding protein
VLLLGLSSGHKLGLGLTAAVFAGFSLIVSMLIPRWRPQFPGRGLPVFVALTVLLFAGMLAAVEIFGKESKSEAAGGEQKTAPTTQPATTAPSTGTTAPSVQKVSVVETEYKISLPKTTLAAGKYSFEVSNQGKIPHNLVVKGPGGTKATPDVDAGKSATLEVELKPGTYDFYCSIPGHKQLGMDQKVTVS